MVNPTNKVQASGNAANVLSQAKVNQSLPTTRVGAAAKTRHCISNGYAGLMLFRTDMDPEGEGSLLGAVYETIREESPDAIRP